MTALPRAAANDATKPKRKSTAEQLAELARKKAQLLAQMESLAARQKSEDRKRETRRKIVVGGAVLAHAEFHPAFRAALRDVLAAAVTRDIDKAVIADLLGDPAAQPSPPNPPTTDAGAAA